MTNFSNTKSIFFLWEWNCKIWLLHVQIIVHWHLLP